MESTSSRRIPKYRLHKATGQAYVELNGVRHYLGLYERPETRERYNALLAEWSANGGRLMVSPAGLTVIELCAQYSEHATAYYRKADGTPTTSIDRCKAAVRALRDYYGSTPVSDFGPKKLKALRQTWIDAELARKTVNDYVAEVKHIFEWGTSEELVPASTYHALQSVKSLKRGRSAARETETIEPVAHSHIEAVLPYLSRQVAALVNLQLLTGARGGELLRLRPIDFDMSGVVWTVKLRDHKTAYRGKERVLYFGEKAQAIIREFLDRPLNAYLFSPREAEAERRKDAPTHRRPNQRPNPRKTERVLGECYREDTYRRAITRACKETNVPEWTPHRLRHTAATQLRKQFGLEAAQVILGHSHADVTQIYAEANTSLALEVAAKVG